MEDKYVTTDFWFEFFETNGYKFAEERPTKRSMCFKKDVGRVKGDIIFFIDPYCYKTDSFGVMISGKARVEVSLFYLMDGLWCIIDRVIIDDREMEEVLLVARALTHPDLLPLCLDIHWAEGVITNSLGEQNASEG